MSFIASALLLCSAIASWVFARAARSYAKLNLRFAALLYAGLASAGALAGLSASGRAHVGLAVGLLVSALAPPLLALAVIGTLRRPPASGPSAAALTLTTLAALAAAATGLAVLALIPQICAALAIGVVALRGPRAIAWRLALSALALCGGALAIVADTQEAIAILSLFSAAGLLGVTRALIRSDAAVQ